jgi:hypothetical protein
MKEEKKTSKKDIDFLFSSYGEGEKRHAPIEDFIICCFHFEHIRAEIRFTIGLSIEAQLN